MKRVFVLSAMLEAATGVALVIMPSFVVRLLFGEAPTGVAVPAARMVGLALISLGVACWPGPPMAGLLTYNATVSLYLAYVGLAGGFAGTLLWPAVIAHAIVTALLVREAKSARPGASGAAT